MQGSNPAALQLYPPPPPGPVIYRAGPAGDSRGGGLLIMAEPTKKSEEIETALKEAFNFDRRDFIRNNRCVPPPIGCGKPALGFRDALSAKEYQISGLCQECQDAFFGADA